MTLYLHSNVTGIYLFDENFKLLDSIPIKNPLERDFSEWSSEEKQVIQKNKKEKITFLGFKNTELDNVKLSQDQKKLEKIAPAFNYKEFYKPNLLLTKRAVKESVNEDLFIIHASNNINEIDKSVNILTKRLREWYELYLPEFSKSIGDHESFTKLILTKSKQELLKEINLQESESMGAPLSKDELKPIMDLAESIKNLYELRDRHEEYINNVMSSYCPNLHAIAGTMIGAKLLALAGSLRKMVMFPASTLQLLGAEKALFRHMKSGAKPPKYGILINHPLVMKAKSKDKGKVARALADKISIAVKVDFHHGEFIGDQLKEKLEKRFQ